MSTTNYADTLDPLAFQTAEVAQHLIVLKLAALGLANLADADTDGYTGEVAVAANAAYLHVSQALEHTHKAAERLLTAITTTAAEEAALNV